VIGEVNVGICFNDLIFRVNILEMMASYEEVIIVKVEILPGSIGRLILYGMD
jgi:hypothetical protein